MMKTRNVLAAAAAGLMGVGVLGACAPEAPAPAPDPDPDAVTTTADVAMSCVGTGLSADAVIDDQTTSVAITLPASVTEGETFDVLVNIGNLNLSAAPEFLNLNGSGVVATIATTGTATTPTVAANNFVGNGASIDLNVAGGTAVATAGTNTFEVGLVKLAVGETGFECLPIGAGASASVEAV